MHTHKNAYVAILFVADVCNFCITTVSPGVAFSSGKSLLLSEVSCMLPLIVIHMSIVQVQKVHCRNMFTCSGSGIYTVSVVTVKASGVQTNNEMCR